MSDFDDRKIIRHMNNMFPMKKEKINPKPELVTASCRRSTQIKLMKEARKLSRSTPVFVRTIMRTYRSSLPQRIPRTILTNYPPALRTFHAIHEDYPSSQGVYHETKKLIDEISSFTGLYQYEVLQLALHHYQTQTQPKKKRTQMKKSVVDVKGKYLNQVDLVVFTEPSRYAGTFQYRIPSSDLILFCNVNDQSVTLKVGSSKKIGPNFEDPQNVLDNAMDDLRSWANSLAGKLEGRNTRPLSADEENALLKRRIEELEKTLKNNNGDQ